VALSSQCLFRACKRLILISFVYVDAKVESVCDIFDSFHILTLFFTRFEQSCGGGRMKMGDGMGGKKKKVKRHLLHLRLEKRDEGGNGRQALSLKEGDLHETPTFADILQPVQFPRQRLIKR
jgi:hypothetical protein